MDKKFKQVDFLQSTFAREQMSKYWVLDFRFSPEDVHVEKGGALKLEHEEQGVEDDEEEDEVLKRCRRDQPPYVVSAW